MSSEPTGVASLAVQMRKERIHTTMLIELLALMVFMAMAFAFVQKEQDQRTNPLAALVKRLEAEVKAVRIEIGRLNREVFALRSQNSILAEANRRLFAQLRGTQPSVDPPVALPKSQLDKLNADLARARAQNAALKIENGKLGGKGVGLPNCLVGGGFYFKVLLTQSGYHVDVMAPEDANPVPTSVEGLKQLTATGQLSEAEFVRRSTVVRRWGLAQASPCIFSAKVKENHRELALYKRQTATVSHAFYWGPG